MSAERAPKSTGAYLARLGWWLGQPGLVRAGAGRAPVFSREVCRCRVCYEDLDPARLQSDYLCDCRGSVAFVCRTCMREWAVRSGQVGCELCRAERNMANWADAGLALPTPPPVASHGQHVEPLYVQHLARLLSEMVGLDHVAVTTVQVNHGPALRAAAVRPGDPLSELDNVIAQGQSFLQTLERRQEQTLSLHRMIRSAILLYLLLALRRDGRAADRAAYHRTLAGLPRPAADSLHASLGPRERRLIGRLHR